MEPNELGKLIARICKGIVEKPNAIKVHVNATESMGCFVINADEDDVSRLLGKGGRNIKAIAGIAGQIGKRQNYSVKINIDSEKTESRTGKFSRFENNPNYKPKNEVELLVDILNACMVWDDVKAIDVDKFTTALIIYCPLKNEFLNETLTAVFGAIGKNKGHILYVEMK